jgi:DUF4097 and DUF4098 domain-containing protein YvlB
MQSGRSVIGVAAAVVIGAAPAAAQEAPARVHVVVPVQAVREVVAVARDVARDVERAVARELRGVARLRVEVTAAQQQGRQAFRAEQTDRRTETLKIGASGLLELANLSGDISVTAGTGSAVRLEIVREARGRTEADARRGLDEVRVNVEQKGERASVRPIYPDSRQQGQRTYSVSVAYIVTAPPGTRLTIASTSGDVVVRDIKGDISATVTSGDITITGGGQVSSVRAISGDVTVRDSTSDSGISAGTMSGTVLFERVKARRIGVDVTGGDIILRNVAADSAQLKTLSGDVEFTGALTRGGRYELQSHSGDVLLGITGGAGFELQVQTFAGSISIPPNSLDFRNVSTARRSLRGTVGDGSAIVTITTFSGDVRIGKK